jgi:RNA polymerase sigma-70 factor (ECF subfamily)
MDQETPPRKAFPTTRWSLIVQVKSDDPMARGLALSEICKKYWPPVYAFYCSCGCSRQDAEDLTQGLFLSLIERDNFAKADAGKGRLRGYLLKAAQNHLRDARRHGCCQKRGEDMPPLPLDFSAADARCISLGPANTDTPERVFEKQWAISLMENVVAELEETYKARGQGAAFRVLSPYIVAHAARPPHAELAASLGISPLSVRVAIHRLRQRYADIFRRTVGATLEPGESVEEEISRLMAVF